VKDEPGTEVHRAVDIGRRPYEEVVVFLRVIIPGPCP
jgi:hypothetical protein